ncbi:MAG TPA: hypothetical protein VJQ55_18170, partial [Candidatus Binatia bacterium]|nr:hypothetical protein [Candidatus Binatia bacterium]
EFTHRDFVIQDQGTEVACVKSLQLVIHSLMGLTLSRPQASGIASPVPKSIAGPASSCHHIS